MTQEEISTIIGQGVYVDGNITIHSSIRILGTLRGNIVSTGTVEVLPGGLVDGDVTAKDAVIKGIVNGTLTATHTASLEQGSSLSGDLYTAKVALAEGSTFNGKCTMIRRKELVIDQRTKEVKLVDLSPEEMLSQS